ncbi:MAG: hypothetical protein DMF86_16985 [Acidobacteria bacterium]|nr:MAG: hypothetical protein DMF86_16985 [Acidobacteriota bacterium]
MQVPPVSVWRTKEDVLVVRVELQNGAQLLLGVSRDPTGHQDGAETEKSAVDGDAHGGKARA